MTAPDPDQELALEQLRRTGVAAFAQTLYHDGRRFVAFGPVDLPPPTPAPRYRVFALGYTVPEARKPAPFWAGFRNPLTPGLVWLVYLMRIFVDEGKPWLFVQIKWQPDWTDVEATHHGRGRATAAERKALDQAEAAIRPGIGQDTGRRTLEEEPGQPWRQIAEEAERIWLAERGKTKWREIARRLLGGASPQQLDSNARRLREWRKRLQKLRAEGR